LISNIFWNRLIFAGVNRGQVSLLSKWCSFFDIYIILKMWVKVWDRFWMDNLKLHLITRYLFYRKVIDSSYSRKMIWVETWTMVSRLSPTNVFDFIELKGLWFCYLLNSLSNELIFTYNWAFNHEILTRKVCLPYTYLRNIE
jgi:hypothetical protein